MRRPATSLFAVLTLVAGLLSAPAADAAKSTAVTFVDVGGAPSAVAVHSVIGMAYVVDPAGGRVVVVNLRAGTVVASIAVGSAPADVAVDELTGRVYVADSKAGTVSVIDGMAGNVVAVVPAGAGASTVAVDPLADRVYVGSGSSGAVTVLDGISDTKLSTIQSPVTDIAGVAVDADRRLAYFSGLDTDTVEVLDTAAGRFVATAHVGQSPAGLAVDEGTGTVYVANSAIHHLSVVDAGAHTERATILLRSEASSVDVDQGTGVVYANGGPNGIVRIDGDAAKLTGELTLGINPGDLAVDQNTGTICVTDPLHGTLSLVRNF